MSGLSRPSKLKKIAEFERDYYKEEALRLLTGPMDEIAHLFQAEFALSDFYSDLKSVDWATGTIIIEFVRKNPTSDEIRDTIFTVYKRQWGGKPEGLEVIYKRKISVTHGPDWSFPICLYITSSPQVLSAQADLLGFVLDDKEYQDWELSREHQPHKRSHQPAVVSLALVNAMPSAADMQMEREVDPGAQVPVVRMGLFKV